MAINLSGSATSTYSDDVDITGDLSANSADIGSGNIELNADGTSTFGEIQIGTSGNADNINLNNTRIFGGPGQASGDTWFSLIADNASKGAHLVLGSNINTQLPTSTADVSKSNVLDPCTRLTLQNTNASATDTGCVISFETFKDSTDAAYGWFGLKSTSTNNANQFIWLSQYSSGYRTRRTMMLNQAGNLSIIGTYSPSSDISLKKNITDANSQWNDIKGLRLRNYDWKDRDDAPRQLGIIAQEVEKVCPNLIIREDDEPLKYSFEGLVFKMLGALKESQSRIEALEAEVQSLKGGN